MSDKKKKSLKNLICAGLFGLVVLSGARGARGTCVDSNSVVQDGIEYYMQTDKAVYSLGENVKMMYRLTNLSYSSPVTFEFRNAQQWHFEVRDAETRIWYWPKQINPATTSFTLYPRDVKGFSIEWDMLNDNTGSLVSPGNYDVIGALYKCLSHGIGEVYMPVSVQIEIVEGPYCGDANHPYPAGDLNHDCRVNLLDLAILASHWLECTAPECD